MQVEIVLNGGVTLVLLPQNEMEERILQEVDLQDNNINLIRSSVMILNRTISKGLIISKKNSSVITLGKGDARCQDDESEIEHEDSEKTV